MSVSRSVVGRGAGAAAGEESCRKIAALLLAAFFLPYTLVTFFFALGASIALCPRQ